MTYGQEKRRLLGLLALLAPLPLPLNDALEWWFLLIYLGAVGSFLQRVERGDERWLSNRALNLLGLAYIPVLFVDLLRGLERAAVLDPLLHLILFLLVVKLFSLRTEREKWHILVAIFFVFAGSMATSSHLGIAPFLITFTALASYVLGRFAHLYVIGGLGLDRRAPTAAMPTGRSTTFGVVISLLVAVPVFALLPRFGDPFIFGQGSFGAQRVAGFSDEVDLSQTSSIRGNREVVMRLRFDSGAPRPDMRFKGGTYDRFENQRWQRRSIEAGGRSSPQRGSFFISRTLRPTTARAEVFLQPLRSRSLVLPLETLAVEDLDVPLLYRDGGGAFSLPQMPREQLRFTLRLGDEAVIRAGTAQANLAAALDETGVSEPMRQLARQVMGEGSDGERIDRLEKHLIEGYRYSLDQVADGGGAPLDRFLFETRSGHCELFASSMVLLLRAEGIPARLVAGFLGVEHNNLEGYYIVRQDNAHAWVEAYAPERGWQVYDPTPPEGRPSARPWSLRLAVSQLYDAVIFRWDRYVLTFGAADQAGLFDRLREALRDAWSGLAQWWQAEDEISPSMETVADEQAIDRAPQPTVPARWWWLAAPFVAAVVFASIVLVRRRSPSDLARWAYGRVRQRLEKMGAELTAATPPGTVARMVASEAPLAASAARQIVELYLRESFGGRGLDESERLRVRGALGNVLELLTRGRRVSGRRARSA